MRDAFEKRRDLLFEQLKAIDDLQVILPDGAFYFYPDFRHFLGRTTPQGKKIEDIEQLCLYLIDEVGLALVPGTAFGTDSHARISYAYAPETLNDAVDRLATGLGKL
jgi:aspartate aminotransferase